MKSTRTVCAAVAVIALWAAAAAFSAPGPARDAGSPGSQPEKKVRLDDLAADENFETTEGLDLIWQLQADPANVAISSPGAELEGLAYYDAEYRWPAVRGARGSLTVTVAKAGKFHPALVVYDTAGRETYECRIDGKRVGRFLAAEDDNRQRVHFLSRPFEFRGGEKLTFVAGGSGAHITEDVLLLASKPPIRGRQFEIRQVEAGYVERSGQPQVRLTWITTWPAACTVEFGPSPTHGRKITEEKPWANHRVFLAGLTPGEQIHYRIVAPRPDGKPVAGEDMVFRFAPPAPVAGTARREQVPLKVENPYDFALTDFPITSGVPFPRGELGTAEHVRLLDDKGREIAVQPRVAARWQDGSVKWLRISFQADVEAKRTAAYTLEYGAQVQPRSAASLLKHSRQGRTLTVDTGPLRVQFDAHLSGFPTRVWFDADGDGKFTEEEDVTSGRPMAAEVTDVHRTRYTTACLAGRIAMEDPSPVQIEVEESGPARTVIKLSGHQLSIERRPMFAYTNRFTLSAGSPVLRVEYTWGNDVEKAPFAEFDVIGLHLPLAAAPAPRWTIGIDGKSQSGQGEMRLSQLRDGAFELAASGGPAAQAGPSRADGWIDLGGEKWGLVAALRDFWQLYPKGFRVDKDALWIDLCPDFPEGTYDKCSKLEEIKLYYYLMGGKYKVAQGVQKQHDLMLCFHPNTPAGETQARQLARAFQEPLIAVCAPERYCGTQVFGDILPATTGRWPQYEKVCQRVYQGYLRHRDGGHEFGMLTFGDQWGERKVNWANGEYDHHHAFLMQFARTGDRRWYFLGEKAARHAIDVDTCHHGPRRGGEWIHAMGHTGGYFKQPYEGSGIPSPGMSVSHTWTEGFYDWYVLSGDPTGAENAALVADYYDGASLNNYDWGNCRTNGWHLLLTMAAYRATNDPYYLNAARIIVERTLQRQTPGGGWHRQMVPGHCHDMPRHRGEANFMLGVLANGLEEYYREVPDPRVAAAIVGGAKQAVRELWVESASGFRYTSCPNMTGYTANNDMTAEILFFAHCLGGDPEFARIANKAMEAAFRDGIGSIAHLRWTPHILFNMDRLKHGQDPRGTQR